MCVVGVNLQFRHYHLTDSLYNYCLCNGMEMEMKFNLNGSGQRSTLSPFL